MFSLSKVNKSGKTMKDILSETICDMAKNDSKVVGLDADLAVPSGMASLRKDYSDRFIDCGIMEQNMAGVAAGLSDAGAIPYLHTFSAFASRKCADQIFMELCYPKANAKILGSDPGVTAQDNGGSHQGMEDMGILLGYHNITLMEPCDPVIFEWMLRKVKDIWGVHYIRFFRRGNDSIYEEGSTFEIGKANALRDGNDLTIVVSGIEVKEALKASEILEQQGIYARVIDMFTWKPLDEETLIKCADETGAFVVAENHCKDNGLGNAVAGVLARTKPCPCEFIGIDNYGEVGDLDFLMKKFCLTSADIVEAAKKVVQRKKM